MPNAESRSAAAELQRALENRYVVEELIGVGGMARVYTATDLRLNRRVAIKVMKSELAGRLGPERFVREVSIAAKLSHPGIVPVFESGESGNGTVLYYVMPLVEGETLRARLDAQGRMTVEDALEIAAGIADALSFAHAAGFVHRDIKPDNVLLQGNRTLVADFGLAKAIELAAGDAITSHRVAVGTLAYMSPEQASASPVVDGRSDLYSLALVTYEMLAGEVPFYAPTPDAILARKAAGIYQPLRVVRPAVPQHVDDAIARALQSVPADRFQTVADFATALKTPTGAVPVTRESSRAVGAWTWGSIAAVAAVAVTAGVVMTNRSGTAPEPASLGRIVAMPLENRTGDPAFASVGLMASDWITDGLQQTGIVEVVPTTTAIETSQLVLDSAGGSVPDPMRAVGRETGARTIVAGSYYRHGDRLLFRVNVADAGGMRLLVSLSDVSAPVSDPLSGVQEVRDRLMGWLALRRDERWRTPAAQSQRMPRYDAYREFSQGLSAYTALRSAEALPRFLQAYALDSTFTTALLYASITLSNMADWARADSLLSVVQRRRATLSEYHQAWLDYRLAFVRGERLVALRAIRRAAELAPQSKAAYNHAVEAMQTGHVHEAAAALEALPSDRGAMRGFPPYWGLFAATQHALGRFDRERDAGAALMRGYPDRISSLVPEARARAARGELSQLDALVRQAAGMPRDPIGFDNGILLVEAAEELNAHGRPEAARDYLRRARAWLLTQPDNPAMRWRLAQVNYALGRWAEARTLIQALRASDARNIDWLAMSGLLDARTSRAAAARAVMDTLRLVKRAYDRGASPTYRARIAAVLGDKDVAVSQLQEAFAAGRAYQLWLHRDPDLILLRGQPQYDQLVRGRD